MNTDECVNTLDYIALILRPRPYHTYALRIALLSPLSTLLDQRSPFAKIISACLRKRLAVYRAANAFTLEPAEESIAD